MITGKLEANVKLRSGPGKADGASMKVLSRKIHWTPVGIEYEADQRHAEMIVARLGLGTGNKGATSPGVARKKE